MDNAVKKIVILGGGTAGWLTAGVIAAEHKTQYANGLEITLIESPDVKPIGVGEGTWPSMRTTLLKMGVSETDLFRECEASFKQGVKFEGWLTGKNDDHYFHPFVLPQGYMETDLVFSWQELAKKDRISFADAVTFQSHLCARGLAPKQIITPEYAAVANYAYHLNAVKLGDFLKKHCIEKLGITYILDNVTHVNSTSHGDIASLATQSHHNVDGDLFIDCSGASSLLLGEHFGIPFVDKKNILFNDTALAVQVPYEHEDSPIASHTISSAQSAGWVWDIGLPSRRGVGHVYSSAHISDEAAANELTKYIGMSIGDKKAEELSFRKIPITPGHREKFWHKNCVAVGMAAGFLEPLEASALVLVELSAAMISDEIPATHNLMNSAAKRFNRCFLYRWDRIIEFLKLHYILTQRTDSEYWIENGKAETIPDRLVELMLVWRYNQPSKRDFYEVEEVFGPASWQYILYGMQYVAHPRQTNKYLNSAEDFKKIFLENKKMINKCLELLPSNRELIEKIIMHGMQKV